MTKGRMLLTVIFSIVLTASLCACDPTVYVTKTGKTYHADGCSALSGSKIPVLLSEALYSGYTPHSQCEPPTDTVAPPPKYEIEPLALPYGEDPDRIIRYKGFALLYDEEYEQAAWVAYLLTKEEEAGSLERPDNFRPDANVATGSAAQADYDDRQYIPGPGAEPQKYARGHLAPDADMDWDFLAVNQTYLFSNMSPMVPAFNSGIWARLEDWVRNQARTFEEVYVVTGPVLTDGPFQEIGPNGVDVPKRYFKVVLDYKEPELKAIGFILPNEPSSLQPKNFAVSVDQVEEITGLDFFYLLEDDIEKALESSGDIDVWSN